MPPTNSNIHKPNRQFILAYATSKALEKNLPLMKGSE